MVGVVRSLHALALRRHATPLSPRFPPRAKSASYKAHFLLAASAAIRNPADVQVPGRPIRPAQPARGIHAAWGFLAADTCKVGGGWIRLPLRPNLLLNSGENREHGSLPGFAGKSTGERSGPYPPAPPSPGRLRVSTRHAAYHAPASRRPPGYAGSRAFPVKPAKQHRPQRRNPQHHPTNDPKHPTPQRPIKQQVGAEGEPLSQNSQKATEFS